MTTPPSLSQHTESPRETVPIVIQALPVGGGILALSTLPGAGGDYAGDLEHLSSWMPAMVITLATAEEMAEARAEKLGAQMQDRGTRWVHFKIATDEVPQEAGGESWDQISDRARRALKGGGRVVVLCGDGGARSAMVALRLMIETGAAPGDTKDRLASAQEAGIGNATQINWAKGAQPNMPLFMRHSE